MCQLRCALRSFDNRYCINPRRVLPLIALLRRFNALMQNHYIFTGSAKSYIIFNLTCTLLFFFCVTQFETSVAKRGTTRVLAGRFLTNVNEREIEKEKKKKEGKKKEKKKRGQSVHRRSFFSCLFFFFLFPLSSFLFRSTTIRDSIRAWLISGWLRNPHLTPRTPPPLPYPISIVRRYPGISRISVLYQAYR